MEVVRCSWIWDMFWRKKLEEFVDELNTEIALIALTSSYLFEFRAFFFFWSTSVIMFPSLLSNTNKY